MNINKVEIISITADFRKKAIIRYERNHKIQLNYTRMNCTRKLYKKDH